MFALLFRKFTVFINFVVCRAFAVVASALGIPSLLPFLKAVCRSKKSWQARHTGIKIVQQIAILMGCAILPHLRNLVEIIEHGKMPMLNFWKHPSCCNSLCNNLSYLCYLKEKCYNMV